MKSRGWRREGDLSCQGSTSFTCKDVNQSVNVCRKTPLLTFLTSHVLRARSSPNLAWNWLPSKRSRVCKQHDKIHIFCTRKNIFAKGPLLISYLKEKNGLWMAHFAQWQKWFLLCQRKFHPTLLTTEDPFRKMRLLHGQQFSRRTPDVGKVSYPNEIRKRPFMEKTLCRKNARSFETYRHSNKDANYTFF